FFLLLYIQAPLQSALFALDLAKSAMWNSLIGSICKFTVLVLLTSQSKFGIIGVAIAMSVSVVLITLLHLATLYTAIGFSLKISDLLKMGLLVVTTYVCGLFLKQIYVNSNEHFVTLLFIFLILSLIYICLLFIFKFISRQELKQLNLFNK